MRIIVPMAGMGKRMRPHTLTVPKPLVPIAGKPIVERLVLDIAALCDDPIEEVAFIVGEFGEAVEKQLIEVANRIGAKGSIHYQKEALGTAHAVFCAETLLQGPVVVAFADTLFKADFTLDSVSDGIIWTSRVEDPCAFGVVNLDGEGYITEFEEKPEHPKSDLAIIGIYYFKSGETLHSEIKYLLDNKITEKGEYQLTNALENMKAKGMKFRSQIVEQWMDCGNKNATVETNQRYLDLIHHKENLRGERVVIENSLVIEPCYFGDDVHIVNSVVGPHVSIGQYTKLENCVVNTSIIQSHSVISGSFITNSMVGNHATIVNKPADLSVGDYNQIHL